MRYRKKPVVIEAVQYAGNGNMTERGSVPDWLYEAFERGVCRATNGSDPLVIRTLEGEHICSPGDWIIRGVKGELYPCKPDIFAATYEPADPSATGTAEPRAVEGYDPQVCRVCEPHRIGTCSDCLESVERRAVEGEVEADFAGQLDIAKRIIRDTLWMARRYAHGRQTYAPSMVREAIRLAAMIGVEIEDDHTLASPHPESEPDLDAGKRPILREDGSPVHWEAENVTAAEPFLPGLDTSKLPRAVPQADGDSRCTRQGEEA